MPYIIRPPHLRKLATGLFGAFALIGATPALAATSCPKTATSHAFQKFGDNASYSLVEGGLFESGAPGWSLRNADVIDESPEQENQSYDQVRQDSGHSQSASHSLAIDSDGSAVSPAFCVDSEHPSFRFLARQRWDSGGSLDVSLRWTDRHGTHETSDATLEGDSSWKLSPVLRLASKLPAGVTPEVRLVFQPTDGSWVIDDVYIDPYSR